MTKTVVLTESGSATVKTAAAVGRISKALAKAGVSFTCRPTTFNGWWSMGYEGDAFDAFTAAIAAEQERTKRLTLTITHDPSPLSPADADGVWMLYSFNRDHAGSTGAQHYSPGERSFHVRPEERGAFFTEGGLPLGWLATKLCAGLAWPLRQAHEGWAIDDRAGKGGEGFLVWEEPPENMGAKTREDRRKDAKAFLEEWNAWASGNAYAFDVRDENGDSYTEVEGMQGGFLGSASGLEYLAEEIHAAVERAGEGAHIVRVKGDAAGVAHVVAR